LSIKFLNRVADRNEVVGDVDLVPLDVMARRRSNHYQLVVGKRLAQFVDKKLMFGPVRKFGKVGGKLFDLAR
jgi:hypothetical protein